MSRKGSIALIFGGFLSLSELTTGVLPVYLLNASGPSGDSQDPYVLLVCLIEASCHVPLESAACETFVSPTARTLVTPD